MEENRRYTSESQIQEYLNTTISEGDADDAIMSAQRYIEEYTGRIFRADEEASTRLFNGLQSQVLDIDDCIEVTKVEVGSNFWGDSFDEISGSGTGDRYYVEPRNYSSENVPISRLILRNRVWIEGQANHRITAKWGYSEVPPADIQFCATVIASGIYNYSRGATGDVKKEKIGNYEVMYDVDSDKGDVNDLNQVKSILDSYQKIII